MIRINLLPGKKPKRAEASQRHLVFMAGGVVLGAVAIAVFHLQLSSELEDVQRENIILAGDIEKLKAELGDYDKVKGQRDELLKQRKTIEDLEKKRTGPVFVLREISEILTPGKGPTFDSVGYQEALMRDPNVGFNPSWDPRQVWLESFDEDGRRVRIKGAAKSNEDVSEFLKRLNLSVFFSEVNFESSAQQVTGAGSASTVKFVNFNLSTTVIY